jgi:hypothetical protein
VDPILLPPDELRRILLDMKDILARYPRLALPADPKDGIWNFYRLIAVRPVVLADCLVVTLYVPLVDKSVSLTINRAYSVPINHPKLPYSFEYQLESKYIVITEDERYVTLPVESDVVMCLMTAGRVCVFHTALYAIDTMNWCILALYRKDLHKIEKYCQILIRGQLHNEAYHLGNNLWLLSVIKPDQLHVSCLKDTHYLDVNPEFALLSLPDSCEVYSPRMRIPAKVSISSLVETPNIARKLVGFSTKTSPSAEQGLFQRLGWQDTNQTDLRHMINQLGNATAHVTLLDGHLRKFEHPQPGGPLDVRPFERTIHEDTLEDINENYPEDIPWVMIMLAIVAALLIIFILAVLILCWRAKQHNRLQQDMALALHGEGLMPQAFMDTYQGMIAPSPGWMDSTNYRLAPIYSGPAEPGEKPSPTGTASGSWSTATLKAQQRDATETPPPTTMMTTTSTGATLAVDLAERLMPEAAVLGLEPAEAELIAMSKNLLTKKLARGPTGLTQIDHQVVPPPPPTSSKPTGILRKPLPEVPERWDSIIGISPTTSQFIKNLATRELSTLSSSPALK